MILIRFFLSFKVQLNECQKSKAKLISTLTEQEGILKGLQSERREWSTNLANQSSELAREKGSLLAQIEKLKNDLDNDLENRNRVKIKEKELESALEALKESKLKITKLKTSNEKVNIPVSKFCKSEDFITKLKMFKLSERVKLINKNNLA